MLVHHRVTWFIYYEVTRSITTPPWMDATPLQGYPRILSPLFIYTPAKGRSSIVVSVLDLGSDSRRAFLKTLEDFSCPKAIFEIQSLSIRDKVLSPKTSAKFLVDLRFDCLPFKMNEN